MAPFLVSFSFFYWLLLFFKIKILGLGLKSFPIVTHGSPPVCFSFYILFSFDFFPLFLFFCIFSFPSLLSFFGAPFLSLFFSPFPCFFLFCPSFLAPLLDPRGASARYAPPRIRHCNYFPGFFGKNIKNSPPSKLFLFTSRFV